MRRELRIRAVVPCLLALAACAAKRPVFYPNAAYREAGADAAQRDVDACLEFAHREGHGTPAAARAGGEAVGGAAVGAATGAAVGAVVGGAGRGAAAGAAGGGTAALLHGIFRSRDPDPIERSFVEQCLGERGYQVIGWE